MIFQQLVVVKLYNFLAECLMAVWSSIVELFCKEIRRHLLVLPMTTIYFLLGGGTFDDLLKSDTIGTETFSMTE